MVAAWRSRQLHKKGIRMIYRVLKWISGIALHWFYGEIRISGRNRIPLDRPLLLAVNHHNALIDSLLTGWIMPQRISMTAKATFADNPILALLFRLVGVVPLRRLKDELTKRTSRVDSSRNENAFAEILRILQQQGAVLIFPEGKSHSERGLEPLRTGLARIALRAREASIERVTILPIGLIFEQKGTPGSAAGIRVGDPVDIDRWPDSDPVALTREIASRLEGLITSGMPDAEPISASSSPISTRIITTAAWWGRLTHQLPIKLARSLALRRSTDADQPAMLTILFGLGLVITAYGLQAALLSALVHSPLVVLSYLASLIAGAYWAAFEKHPAYR
jgi:1-acyl-sn-glycerol-3-phosphate acyltransferase